MELTFGLITCMFFWLFLQKAEVIRYDRQLGALRLKDMTIVKFMLTPCSWAWSGFTCSTTPAWPGSRSRP